MGLDLPTVETPVRAFGLLLQNSGMRDALEKGRPIPLLRSSLKNERLPIPESNDCLGRLPPKGARENFGRFHARNTAISW
jgi:hypothetical protein